MKVIRKKKDNINGKEIEDEIVNDEIIYETGENKPNVKILRKKKILKNGKEEEIEEVPKNNLIYMVKRFGNQNDQSKIIRKNIISKYGRDRQIEEDIPGDELIIKTIKE